MPAVLAGCSGYSALGIITNATSAHILQANLKHARLSVNQFLLRKVIRPYLVGQLGVIVRDSI